MSLSDTTNKLLPSFRLSSGLTALNGQFAGYGRPFPTVNTKAPPLRVICRMRRPALKPKLLDAGLPLLVREQPIRHGAVNQHSETARIGVQAFRSVDNGVHRSSPGANLIFSPANLKTRRLMGLMLAPRLWASGCRTKCFSLPRHQHRPKL